MQGEFIFKTAKLIEWQKWLNQWRHTYSLTFHFIEINKDKETEISESKTIMAPEEGSQEKGLQHVGGG